jgi:hypothetical protein
LLFLACHNNKPSGPFPRYSSHFEINRRIVCEEELSGGTLKKERDIERGKKGFCGIFKSPALESDFGSCFYSSHHFPFFFFTFMLMKPTHVRFLLKLIPSTYRDSFDSETVRTKLPASIWRFCFLLTRRKLVFCSSSIEFLPVTKEPECRSKPL